MSSFFTAPGAQKKRKRGPTADVPKKRAAASSKSQTQPRKRAEEDDESISGSDSESGDEKEVADALASGSDSENEGETAAEKRLRLAERYLQNVRQEVDDEVGFDAADIDRDLIKERLQLDISESKGKLYKRIASELAFEQATHCYFRNNAYSTTAVATCPPHAYTVHKDKLLVKWRIQDLPANQYPQTTKKKPKSPAPPRRKPVKVAQVKGNHKKGNDRNYKAHVGEILSVAASQDGKFVVTGGADSRLIVYDAKSLKALRVFTHHRDAVTGLAFRRGTNQLYSASKDRSVKVWSLDELAYIETLYGHGDHVVDIDALAQERCISVGARDRTCRLWKVVEETQLVFRGGAVDKKAKPGVDPKSLAHEGSMDCVAMIDDQYFVTGSDNGSISLWSLQKKKPLFVLARAHGIEDPLPPTEASAEQEPDPKRVVPPPQPRSITTLRTLPYSDLILSGSWDGYVRAWRFREDKKILEPAGVLGNPTDVGEVQTSGADADGAREDADDDADNTTGTKSEPWRIKGAINGLSVFERGDHGKDGLCVVAAVGKELRLGRWKNFKGAKNGAVVFEISKSSKSLTNGDGDKAADEA
ncbi:WD40 repeat-like protein [Xylariomycetidae sp. FL0641]|nr:WD40 repeat-like protein [Xylariomycetidae sp. FL0641]